MVSNPFDDISNKGSAEAVALHMDFILQKIQDQIDIAEQEYKDSGEDEDFGAFRALKELKETIIEAKSEFIEKIFSGTFGHNGIDYASSSFHLPTISAARGGIQYTNSNYIPQAYSPQAIIAPNGWNGVGTV